ncbi:glycine-rich domain-containing protein [Paenibacillus silvisoli]|uniref:hypothetical protein n=1 Tax=Paenibacillus silvisoli TaxID=3110539 RepID=UPI0028051B50|nr:hypothetical protein [Paenibacillus silvisoli]
MSLFTIFFLIIIAFIVVKLVQSRGGRPVSGSGSGSGQFRSSTGSRGSAVPMRKPPVSLGVPEGHPARSAAERLEAALSPDFEARVKDRVLKRTPSMREGEWQWQWFELKRYFLMCGVLRNVPMYSVRVDEVWHEMLMFTREYEQFCKQFCGNTIHHAPHTTEAKPNPGERAWFDWIYGELFIPVPVSGQLWGAFYRTPMPQELMRELEFGDSGELRKTRFNERAAAQFGDLAATVDFLIERGKRLSTLRHEPAYQGRSDWDSSGMLTTGMLSGMFFFSSYGPTDQFHDQMDQIQTEEQRNSNSSCGGSVVVCGSGDDSGNGNDSGNGSNDGGSSCSSDSGSGDGGSSSSCGSGSSCGSSCGGGS